jgi:hypothetical protein
MADRVNEHPQIVRASDDHAAEAPVGSAVSLGRRGESRRETSPYSHKFRAAIATLIGIGVGAIVVAIAVLSSSGGSTPHVKWSDWQPSDNGTLGAREIADHIAPLYRISRVDQLDVITVVNLASAPAATTATQTGTSSGGLQVAVQFDPSKPQVSLLNGKTIAYNLCGVGTTNCAIGVGEPSENRLLLLRREALELALYTFKYVNGVQNVVAILPPGHTEQTSTLTSKPPAANSKTTSKPLDVALLFVRDELKPFLSAPVKEVLPEQFPPTVPELSLWRQTPEAGLVDQITARGLFSEKLVQAQDGSNLIVLDPLPPQ